MNNMKQNQMLMNNQMQMNINNNISNINDTFPHKAGLLNVGQSCYMNATIECLYYY